MRLKLSQLSGERLNQSPRAGNTRFRARSNLVNSGQASSQQTMSKPGYLAELKNLGTVGYCFLIHPQNN